MTNDPDLYGSTDAITADWMRRALTAGGADNASSIADVEINNLGSETNAFGNLARCRLITQDGTPAVPPSAIVKLPTTDPMAFRFAKWVSLHRREYDYYRHIAQQAPVASPALLYGHFDDSTHRFVLVLEDLRHMETLSQAVGVDAARAELAIREIAKLHGQFWDATDQPPVSGCYDVLSRRYGRIMQTAYLLCIAPFLERFGDRLSAQTRWLVEALGPRIVAHYASVATGPRTFIHGDYRAENLFFSVHPNRTEERDFAVIDWQGCGLGSGLYDVAYFLGTSVPIEDRRRIELDALREYHAIVCGMGAKNFTFEDCWRSYRQNMIGALVPCVLGGGGARVVTPQVRNTFHLALDRISAAIDDLDVAQLLPAREPFPSAGWGFSTLSLCGYRAYRLVRRLLRKGAA